MVEQICVRLGGNQAIHASYVRSNLISNPTSDGIILGIDAPKATMNALEKMMKKLGPLGAGEKEEKASSSREFRARAASNTSLSSDASWVDLVSVRNYLKKK